MILTCCQVRESLTFFVTCSFHKGESCFLLNWTRSNIGWRPKNIVPVDPERQPMGKEDKSFFFLRRTGDANYWKASPDKNILKWACSYSWKIGNKTFLAKSSLRWHARTQPPLMAILEDLHTGQEIGHHSFSPKRVNDDCCQMSLGKTSTISSKRSLSLLVALLCQIITEPGLLQQLNSNSGTNHHGANSPWREAQKALRIKCTGLCCIPVC